MQNFAGHIHHFDTDSLRLRPFKDSDFDLSLPFYRDPELLNAMEGKPLDAPVTVDYLRRASKSMARQGFLFAVVEKASDRTIGEACLQWMNLERAIIDNEKTMRMPLGIWDRSLWGKGYGTEVVRYLMAFAFGELDIDRLCAMDVSADNYRSLALWSSCGMTISKELDNGKAFDLEISRVKYESMT
ncbi:MAG: GNAT family N-acetyltransferase [Candidatus Poribacteria bacterium]|nr:GNAT family N-acetyltransferase [Candidatus Poribacteria bacterium]MDE0506716.1 GNAT family N-acetyltransferase [Candidatus Poribacteria bacterium]